MKSIHTLVTDIYQLLESEHEWVSEQFSSRLAVTVANRLTPNATKRKGTLRLSKMGDWCPKALWHSVNTPELEEKLPAWAIFKYAYGHVIEALALELARASGHTVEGQQHEVILDGIHGHLDAIIDGVVVDVKSTTSHTLASFKNKSFATRDNFGYGDQLDGYLSACAENPLVIDKNHGYILGVDKTLGHFALYEHTLRAERIRKRIQHYKSIVSMASPPACECETKPYGESGNRCLGVQAGYSAYRHTCFPNLRTFLYSDGPKYFTVVKRLPDVPEIDRRGQLVYIP